MVKLSLVVGLLVLAAATSVESLAPTLEKLQCAGVEVDPLEDILNMPSHPCRKVKEVTGVAQLGADDQVELINECLCNLAGLRATWNGMANEDVLKFYYAIFPPLSALREPFNGKGVEVQVLNALDLEAKRSGDDLFALIEEKVAANVGGQREVEEFLATTCRQLMGSFGPVWEFVKGAEELTGDQDIGYMMTKYDNILFKVALVHRACALISNDQ